MKAEKRKENDYFTFPHGRDSWWSQEQDIDTKIIRIKVHPLDQFILPSMSPTSSWWVLETKQQSPKSPNSCDLSFVPFLVPSSQNPWNFLTDENDNSIFCYMNEVTFGLHLRMAGCQENQPCVQRVGTFSAIP